MNEKLTSQTSPPSPDPPSSDTTSASGISSWNCHWWKVLLSSTKCWPSSHLTRFPCLCPFVLLLQTNKQNKTNLTSAPASVLSPTRLPGPLSPPSSFLRLPVCHLCPEILYGHQHCLFVEMVNSNNDNQSPETYKRGMSFIRRKIIGRMAVRESDLFEGNLIPRAPPIPMALLARAPRWGRIDLDSAWNKSFLDF